MRGLGDLETVVMDVLWSADGALTVREVLDELNRDRQLAYTTVMTVLDNLYRKGWVQRELDNRAYHYRPSESREEAAARAIRELVESTGDPEAVLLHFARSASERESAVLRRGLKDRPRP